MPVKKGSGSNTAPSLESCEDIVDLLSDYMEMVLSPQVATALEHHLADCIACTEYLDTLRRTRDAVAGLRLDEIPDEVRLRLRAFLDVRPAGAAKP